MKPWSEKKTNQYFYPISTIRIILMQFIIDTKSEHSFIFIFIAIFIFSKANTALMERPGIFGMRMLALFRTSAVLPS